MTFREDLGAAMGKIEPGALFRVSHPGQVVFADKPSDPVDHPAHYSRWKMEPIEFIAINNMPYWMANVVKYIMRYDAKDGLKDMYKARSYLEMKIRELEGEKRFWDKPVTQERQLNKAEPETTCYPPYVRALPPEELKKIVVPAPPAMPMVELCTCWRRGETPGRACDCRRV